MVDFFDNNVLTLGKPKGEITFLDFNSGGTLASVYFHMAPLCLLSFLTIGSEKCLVSADEETNVSVWSLKILGAQLSYIRKLNRKAKLILDFSEKKQFLLISPKLDLVLLDYSSILLRELMSTRISSTSELVATERLTASTFIVILENEIVFLSLTFTTIQVTRIV